jgi:pre-mycofactocin synthase
VKIENPWRQNPWFESVAVAQRRARKRLPAPVYDALVAGSERGQTAAENEQAFRELGLAPHVAGNPPVRSRGEPFFVPRTARWRWPARRRRGAC